MSRRRIMNTLAQTSWLIADLGGAVIVMAVALLSRRAVHLHAGDDGDE